MAKRPRLPAVRKRRAAMRPRLRRKIRKFPLLPTTITMGNGVCGLLAIAVVTDAGRDPIDRMFQAGLLIFLGMVFDVADGHAARLMKQTSRFGTELDSLCDLVTFGAAPAFIVMQFNELLPQRFLFGVAASYFIASALRLARFNVQKNHEAKTVFFEGLPTPLAAGTIASVAIAVPALTQLVASETAATRELGLQLQALSMVAVPALSAVLAWLMVSRIRYPHLARQLERRRSFTRLAELLLAGVVVITIHELALPLLFCYYVFIPLVNPEQYRQLKARRAQAREEEDRGGENGAADQDTPDAPRDATGHLRQS